MADNKSTTTGSGQSGGKRPYATLDLKATEVRTTPEDAAKSATRRASDVPRPAPARSYAAGAESQSADEWPGDTKAKASATGASTASSTESKSKEPAAAGLPKRRGGFASHLAAGVAGGVIALAAAQWALPEFGNHSDTSRLQADTASLAQRLNTLEKNEAQSPPSADLSSVEERLASLEKSVQAIPALTDGQRRLVAETKAALASAASDAGSPQLIERLGKVEDKLKAMAEAGANDPNPGRIEQLAALTGKVSDLETSLATQLAALRASVAKDVDSRVQAATEASEAARAGTQRIDKDVAEVKGTIAHLEETVNATTAANSQIAAGLKAAQDQASALKTTLEDVKTSAAKPADIAAAIAPLSERTAALERSVQGVLQDDSARKESARRVVLALELQNLKRAIDSGRNYATELGNVKKVAGNHTDLAPLEQLQDAGVPSLADLTKEFRAAANRAIDADAPQGSGVVDRLWAEAKSVVRVRRIDLKPDDKSTEATIGRMQVALNDGRLGDVLEAAKDLSPNAQAAAQPFLDKVAARVSVDRVLAALESQLKSAIASGAPAVPKPLP
jgi:hypothetical protein